MNGPQHYAEAERLLAVAVETEGALEGKTLHPSHLAGWHAVLANLTGAAQVHATLALVAAQVDAAEIGVFEIAATGASGLTAWGKATGVES
jgi:hypothetical protein